MRSTKFWQTMKTDTQKNTEVEKLIVLDTPIQRGETFIDRICIRKPSAGELRGISLIELAQLNVNALQTVIPRISTPILTVHDVAKLEPADLLEIGTEVASFLMKKAERLAVYQST